jgi:hypothetical protein
MVFDDATNACSGASVENDDHTVIVVHDLRWRLRIAKGETQHFQRGLPQLTPTCELQGAVR